MVKKIFLITSIVLVIAVALTASIAVMAADKPKPTEPEIKTVPVYIETAPAPVTSWEEIPLDAELQTYIVTECEKHNIRPAIVFAMCKRESNYTIDVIGDSGDSYGLLQIQPRWHYKRMLDLNSTNLLDPYHNVTVGIDILAELIEKYDGKICAALVAYNAGSYSGTVTEYAETVINEAERLTNEVMK